MASGTAETAPRIERVGAHIANLERRLEHLKERIREPRNERVRSFDISESKALEAAIRVLAYYRLALEPETDPVLALAELLDATETSDPERLDDAVRRGRRVLRELSAED
jgi:hypothetical protein